MDLKELAKGDFIVTTQSSEEGSRDTQVCYVHRGSDLVGVGVYFDGDSYCSAAIIAEDGKKKVIKATKEADSRITDTVLAELDEAFDIYNDQ